MDNICFVDSFFSRVMRIVGDRLILIWTDSDTPLVVVALEMSWIYIHFLTFGCYIYSSYIFAWTTYLHIYTHRTLDTIQYQIPFIILAMATVVLHLFFCVCGVASSLLGYNDLSAQSIDWLRSSWQGVIRVDTLYSALGDVMAVDSFAFCLLAWLLTSARGRAGYVGTGTCSPGCPLLFAVVNLVPF
ncbi:hypothetical protein BJ165DRAFT_1135945 [Panaeolus papilionaceus]|nr:hypothetical protein BJ165DRAFT_1135945 [Panaeolus papilionaceus]